MAFDTTDVLLSVLKIAVILGIWLNITPIMVWVERRGSALIQDRPGPNRVGPFGLLQSFADALKFIMKEDIVPAQAHRWLYTLAPTFGLFPALTTIAVVPWGRGFTIPEMTLFGRRLFEGGRWFEPVVADVSAGILVVFALASLSVYGITIAGWASSNKYSMFGAVRASAQMISYELSLTLAAVSVLIAAGSLRLTDVVAHQTGYFVLFDFLKLPAWNILSPAMWLSFLVFAVSGFAETNRLPFDFAEAEAELVAGYHTEYSSMKFALFFMAEYMAMGTMAALVTTLYLGGWDIPWYTEPATFGGFLLSFLAFLAKWAFLMFVFVWVRWTIPRLKYDILMRIGWKVFLPMATLIFALVVVLHRNPVVGALSLVASFFALAVMYVLLDAPFLAALQVIVYAGAIMVLFLFVIMLLNLQHAAEPTTRPIQQFLGYTSSAAFAIGLVYFIGKYAVVGAPAPGPFRATAYDIGVRMFEAYIFPFEMVSILLLAAIVGALLLSGRAVGTRASIGTEQSKAPASESGAEAR